MAAGLGGAGGSWLGLGLGLRLGLRLRLLRRKSLIGLGLLFSDARSAGRLTVESLLSDDAGLTLRLLADVEWWGLRRLEAGVRSGSDIRAMSVSSGSLSESSVLVSLEPTLAASSSIPTDVVSEDVSELSSSLPEDVS